MGSVLINITCEQKGKHKGGKDDIREDEEEYIEENANAEDFIIDNHNSLYMRDQEISRNLMPK